MRARLQQRHAPSRKTVPKLAPGSESDGSWSMAGRTTLPAAMQNWIMMCGTQHAAYLDSAEPEAASLPLSEPIPGALLRSDSLLRRVKIGSSPRAFRNLKLPKHGHGAANEGPRHRDGRSQARLSAGLCSPITSTITYAQVLIITPLYPGQLARSVDLSAAVGPAREAGHISGLLARLARPRLPSAVAVYVVIVVFLFVQDEHRRIVRSGARRGRPRRRGSDEQRTRGHEHE